MSINNFLMRGDDKNRAGKVGLFLIILALGVRFAVSSSVLNWGSDISSSQLIARLILKGGGVALGHLNSGLNVHYPPFFYYSQTALRAVWDNYYWVLAVHALLHLGAGYAIYKIVGLFAPRRYGIYALILYLLSPLMIVASANVWSVFFALPLAIIALYPFVEASVQKEIRPYRLIAASLLLVFSTTIHYGAVLELFLVLILVLSFFPGIKSKIFFVGLNLSLFFAFNVSVLSEISIWGLIQRNLAFTKIANGLMGPAVFVAELEKVMAYNSFRALPLLTLGILLFGFVVYFLAEKNKTKKMLTTIFLLYLLVGIYLTVLSGRGHYGMIQFPFFYVLPPIFLSKLFASKRLFIKLIAISTSVYFLLALFPRVNEPIIASNFGRYREIEQLTRSLLEKVKSPKKVLFLVATEQEGKPIFNRSIDLWYFHSYINPETYKIVEANGHNCKIEEMGICYEEVPEEVFLICPRKDEGLDKLFAYSSITPEACEKTYSLIVERWARSGKLAHPKAKEINQIEIDPIKYRNNQI